MDRASRAAIAKTLLAEYHDELARLSAEHQVWLLDHGVEVPDRARKQRTAGPTERSVRGVRQVGEQE